VLKDVEFESDRGGAEIVYFWIPVASALTNQGKSAGLAARVPELQARNRIRQASTKSQLAGCGRKAHARESKSDLKIQVGRHSGTLCSEGFDTAGYLFVGPAVLCFCLPTYLGTYLSVAVSAFGDYLTMTAAAPKYLGT